MTCGPSSTRCFAMPDYLLGSAERMWLRMVGQPPGKRREFYAAVFDSQRNLQMAFTYFGYEHVSKDRDRDSDSSEDLPA